MCHKITSGEENQLHVVAPGEGKIPVSLTFCEDWDAKAFPMLHPDGKNHLSDDKRKRKLSDLKYFKQVFLTKTQDGEIILIGYLQLRFTERKLTLVVILT